ncbi:hypothetical protein ACFWIA_28030 [Streptomyces sp. NPDC127068]|uniref:hypothetical protein n=1 Tax=Streptomyces sp. NPDC127068 TaxID=3347127 RepID=UPI0036497D1E
MALARDHDAGDVHCNSSVPGAANCCAASSHESISSTPESSPCRATPVRRALPENASEIRQKALAQLAAVSREDEMPTDPEDEVIVHQMLEAYFQHYERSAAEHDAPAIGREIADQRRAWAEQQRLAGLGSTWLLTFATEGELNSILKSLEGEGPAEEITRAISERAAVKRWLTSRGHDINVNNVKASAADPRAGGRGFDYRPGLLGGCPYLFGQGRGSGFAA